MSDPSQAVPLTDRPVESVANEGPMKRLYHWTLRLAEKPYAPWALGIIAFAESSFFPVPPDVILIPMSLARPKRAWLYALICTLGSVAGALLGYAIGAVLYETIGKWLIHLYGYDTKIADLRAFFGQWGWAFILVKGLTPIPFKLVTIFCGLVTYNLPLFVLLCCITRGARFFVLALLLNTFGETIKGYLERFFGVFMLALVLMVLAGFYVAAKII
jgi:membrane protein YqaA with SNARE-associated domain